jgi:hypothetical protein
VQPEAIERHGNDDDEALDDVLPDTGMKHAAPFDFLKGERMPEGPRSKA